MPAWLWWAPLGLLLVGVALLGLRYGWIAATITETDVIDHYAQRYLDQHGDGADPSDCVAVPGMDMPGVWIVLRCHPNGIDQRYEYFINRFGGLEHGSRFSPLSLPEPRT